MADEKIYMIPVNDAFSIDCECAFCHLENQFEQQCIETVLGESVMEVDARIETNAKGFCKRHFYMLLEQKNKLPYGLMLETHLNEIKSRMEKIISEHFFEFDSQKSRRFIKSLFSNSTIKESLIKDITEYIDKLNSQCVICERIESRMNNYFDVFFYMWRTKKDFQQKVLEAKGFCLYHFPQLLTFAQNNLSSKELNDFTEKICKIQMDSINRIYENVSNFNKQFDYRNANNHISQEVKNSLINATEKLAKFK